MSRSGYYAFRNRECSSRAVWYRKLVEHVKEAFMASKGRYGSPRVFLDLKAKRIFVSENTVAKIMKEEGLFARKKRAFKVVTLAEEVSDDVHERVFKIEDENNLEINDVWAGDITYIPVDNKFRYLSIVMDLKRRKVLGW